MYILIYQEKPNLDYGDIIIYNYPSNIKLYQKVESVQYNTALAITGTKHRRKTITGTRF